MHASSVIHHRLDLDGIEVFYRAAGPQGAPVVLLPHGYPCSSYEFRAYMPLLADRWRLVAPDFPGCGYSATPEGFSYDFDGYADFLARFIQRLGIERFALYLHDFGSQIGLRLAIAEPQRIAALILQNGDIYEDQLGPKYAALQQFFANPTPQARAGLAEAVSLKGFEEEFLNEVDPATALRIPPDLWHLHWALMTPRRHEIATQVIAGLKDNLAWFPRYQAYLREHQPPTLIVWGPRDGYMPQGSAKAYLRDLPDAELHLFDDGGHWLLETHLEQVAQLSRDFLGRVHSQP
ncbi:alpha/beta fold hydrolase [Stutzerimonas stutzeri]|uniref:Hydrolase n=1 Tax=Stutzerimonas stutzeri TaxID=316 RepID=A0A0D9AWD5_STUST|nr:alpha/beta hydrolase [Stutzerimonas stutzeri]KJH84989.1 hydrolase [Stutzerimonas stutzeri]